jgi:ABC-type multidrug transport system ATPase subunit
MNVLPALDVLTIKMLQEIIVSLQQENNITICICDHQARDLLACVDMAMIINNGKIVAQDSSFKPRSKILMLKMHILGIALK